MKIETVFTAKNLTKGEFTEMRKGFWQTEKELKSAEKAFGRFNLESFNRSFQRTSASFGLFREKSETATKQMQMFRKQAEKLVRSGIDPQNEAVRSLKSAYENIRVEMANDQFNTMKDRMGKNANVMSLTGNKADVLRGNMAFLKKEMQNLVALGIDPQDKRMQDLSGRYKTAVKDVRKLDNSFGSISKRMGTLIKSFVSAQAVLYIVMKAFRAITGTFRDSMKVAADYEETMNLFYTTFEKSATKASDAVADLSNRLGFAESTAMDALGAVGDMAIGFGATDKQALDLAKTVTELTIDLMSFKNIEGDLTENVSAFTSGLLGNTKNLRRYGILVRDANVEANLLRKGLGDLTGEERELAKVQERLNIAIAQSPKALGDMEKTLDSTINVTRQLKEEWKKTMESIGGIVNTVLTPIKRELLGFLKDINSISDELKNIQDKLEVGAVDESTITQLEKMLDVLESKAQGSMEGESFLTKYAKIVNPLWRVLGMGKASKDMKEAGASLVLVRKAIEDANKAAENTALRDVMKAAKDSADDLLFSLTPLIDTLNKDIAGLKTITTLEGEISGEEYDRVKATTELNKLYTDRVNIAEDLGDSNREILDIIKEQKAGQQAINDYYDRRVAYLHEASTLERIITQETAAQSAIEAARVSSDQFLNKPEGIKGMKNQIEFEISLIGMSDTEQKMARLKQETNAMFGEANAEQANSVLMAKEAIEAQRDVVTGLLQERKLLKERNASQLEFEQIGKKINDAVALRKGLIEESKEVVDGMSDVEKAILSYMESRVDLYEAQLESAEKLTAEAKKKAIIDSAESARIAKLIEQYKVVADLLNPDRNQSSAKESYEEKIAAIEATQTIEEAAFNPSKKGIAMATAFDDYLREEEVGKLWAEAFEGNITLGEAAKGTAQQGGFGDVAQISMSLNPMTAFINLIMEVVSEMEGFAEVMGFGKMILAKILKPLKPVLSSILSILKIFDPVIEILTFTMKLVSSALLVLLYPIELVVASLNWLWNSLEVLINNIGIWVYNLLHLFNKKSYQEFSKLGDTWAEVTDRFKERMTDLWKPLDDVTDSAKELANALDELQGLYKSGAISGKQLEQSVTNITGVAPDYAAAGGANFMTSRPTMILAGENGREHVNITPAPKSGGRNGDITVNINGSSGDSRSLAKEVVNEIRRMDRIGYKVG